MSSGFCRKYLRQNKILTVLDLEEIFDSQVCFTLTFLEQAESAGALKFVIINSSSASRDCDVMELDHPTLDQILPIVTVGNANRNDGFLMIIAIA